MEVVWRSDDRWVECIVFDENNIMLTGAINDKDDLTGDIVLSLSELADMGKAVHDCCARLRNKPSS